MNPYKSLETNTKELWYEKNFRAWMKENRGLPGTVLEIIQTINSKNEKKCIGKICVLCIDINEENGIVYSKSFKIEVGTENFFLKIEKRDIPEDAGFEEMQDTLLAKEIIESLNIQGVRIVNPLLGYSDRNNRSYYISEWIDLPLLADALNNMNDTEKEQKIINRIEKARHILEGYREIAPNNMFYDKGKDEIILFDLHL